MSSKDTGSDDEYNFSDGEHIITIEHFTVVVD